MKKHEYMKIKIPVVFVILFTLTFSQDTITQRVATETIGSVESVVIDCSRMPRKAVKSNTE